MKVITITTDLGVPGEKVVKMHCGCEWVEKTYDQYKWTISQQHINARHGGNGRIIHGDDRRSVDNRNLGPVITKEPTNGTS